MKEYLREQGTTDFWRVYQYIELVTNQMPVENETTVNIGCL